jgi:hypothetical protein
VGPTLIYREHMKENLQIFVHSLSCNQHTFLQIERIVRLLTCPQPTVCENVPLSFIMSLFVSMSAYINLFNWYSGGWSPIASTLHYGH